VSAKAEQRYEEAVRRNLDNALRRNRGWQTPRLYTKEHLGIREDDTRCDKEIDEINKLYTQYLLSLQPKIKLRGRS
jgi:hypothetical protein